MLTVCLAASGSVLSASSTYGQGDKLAEYCAADAVGYTGVFGNGPGNVSLISSALGWNTKGPHSIGLGSTNPGKTDPEDMHNANLLNTQKLALRYTEKAGCGFRAGLEFGYAGLEYNRSQNDFAMCELEAILQYDIPLGEWLILRPGVKVGVTHLDKERFACGGLLDLAVPANNGNEFVVSSGCTDYSGPASYLLGVGVSVALGDEKDETQANAGFEVQQKFFATIPGVLGRDLSFKRGDGSETDFLFGRTQTKWGFGLRATSIESKLWTHFADSDFNQRSLDIPGATVFVERRFAVARRVTLSPRIGLVADDYMEDKTIMPKKVGPKNILLGGSAGADLAYQVNSSASLGVTTSVERFVETGLGQASAGLFAGINW